MKITQATLKAIIQEEVANMFEGKNTGMSGVKGDDDDATYMGHEMADALEEDETVDEAHCMPGDRDDDRHPKRDLDHLYAMVRDLERRLDKMDG